MQGPTLSPPAVSSQNGGVKRGALYDTTVPFGEPQLMRASAYQRYLDQLEADTPEGAPSSRISSLSPSLLADLMRFEKDGGNSEVLEVVAACVRHAKSLTIQLHCGDRVVPLTVFAQERLVHCPTDLNELIEKHLPQMRVIHIEAPLLRPPGNADPTLVGESHLHHALAPLLWELAMRSPRSVLLPEIGGPAVYRVAPSLEVATLPAKGALLASVYRLRREAATLREIASWPGLDPERAARLLNGLYLQAGLIISRSHPDAIGEMWFRALTRRR